VLLLNGVLARILFTAFMKITIVFGGVDLGITEIIKVALVGIG
jgi:hypothetical protein